MQADSEKITVYVKDYGKGIPEQYKASVFKKFVQVGATDNRQQGGTGLGLSIAKIIVEKMQGQIWFDTVLGHGTTFYFTLPLKTTG